MKFCNNCHEFFDEPKEYIVKHYEVDTRQDEVFISCPYCDSADIVEDGLIRLKNSLNEIREMFPKEISDMNKATVEEYIIDNLWR